MDLELTDSSSEHSRTAISLGPFSSLQLSPRGEEKKAEACPVATPSNIIKVGNKNLP